MCACTSQRETRERNGRQYTVRSDEGRKGGGVRVCAIEQPPVMRGSMLTRMVSNTAWGNSSFTPRLKPSSLFCLPLSVNISLSPGTDSGVNRNQIMHTNISVTQDFQQSFSLSSSHTNCPLLLACLPLYYIILLSPVQSQTRLCILNVYVMREALDHVSRRVSEEAVTS